MQCNGVVTEPFISNGMHVMMYSNRLHQISKFKAFMHLATLSMICRMRGNWEKHFVVDVNIVTM